MQRLRPVAVSWLPTLFELLLIAKAAAVAVLSPEGLHPYWPEGRHTGYPFVGLVFM